MMEESETISRLLRRVYDVFPQGRPPPRPITGHRCGECDETDRLVGGRTWGDVAKDFPHYCVDVFPLLRPEAKRYYMPSFICFDLENEGYTAGLSVAWDIREKNLRPDQFAPQQRAVVADWLAWHFRHGDDPDAEATLAGWRG